MTNTLSNEGALTAAWGPRNKRERYCLCESGWIELSTGWKFLFGGSVSDMARFHELGVLDRGGFTEAGSKLRDKFGRGKAEMLDRIPAEQVPA